MLHRFGQVQNVNGMLSAVPAWYWQNIGLLKDQADDAYNQGYENWYNANQMGTQAEQYAYEKQLKQYDKLVELITSTGYAPTTDELTAAGMTPAQAQAYKSYYDKQNAPKSTGGGNPTKTPTPTPDPAPTPGITNYNNYSEVTAYMKANGVPGSTISGLMTIGEFNRHKESYVKTGKGVPEVENNPGYSDYVQDYVAMAMAKKRGEF
jgi:hypothetical protein